MPTTFPPVVIAEESGLMIKLRTMLTNSNMDPTGLVHPHLPGCNSPLCPGSKTTPIHLTLTNFVHHSGKLLNHSYLV